MPGLVADVVAARGLGDGPDGPRIGQVVAPRVGFGAGRLAQHVVAVGVALRLLCRAALHRGLDRFAQHELRAHLLHRAANGGADNRLPEPADRAAQMADDARPLVLQDAPRQHQRPGRGVDQRRGRMAHVPAPIRRRDLVLDQRVDRLGIGYPQKRFGKAHEGHALFGREPVFGKEDLHQPRAGGAADVAHEARGAVGDRGAVGLRQSNSRLQIGHQRRLGGIGQVVHTGAQFVGGILGHSALRQLAHATLDLSGVLPETG